MAYDHRVHIVRIMEVRVSMQLDGLFIVEEQRRAVRVAGDDEMVTKVASELLNTWCKENPGKAATYSYSQWFPRDDKVNY